MDWNFFFGFEGRINRARYWCVTLLNALIVLAYMLIVPLSIGDTFRNSDVNWALPLTLALLAGTFGPVFIISIWNFAAVTIKRLHDRDRSGWWMLVFYVAPNVLGAVGDRLGDSYLSLAIALGAVVLGLWGFVEIFCLRGSRGTNRFGADQLAERNSHRMAAY
jgi:uncharacterized membrane protein YhaH (DUF805 family)